MVRFCSSTTWAELDCKGTPTHLLKRAVQQKLEICNGNEQPSTKGRLKKNKNKQHILTHS
jgi:hypothetical protein